MDDNRALLSHKNKDNGEKSQNPTEFKRFSPKQKESHDNHKARRNPHNKKEAHDHTDSKRVSHEEKNDKDDTENKETKKDNSSSSMKNRQ